MAKNSHPRKQGKIQPNKQQIKIQTPRIAERNVQSLHLQPQKRRQFHLEANKKQEKTDRITTSNTQKYYTPGLWAKSDKEKAELFAVHLSEVFTPHNKYQNQEVEQELETPIHQQDRLKPFTLKEIKNENKKLNHKKAPGIDRITATMLEELPQK